MLTEQKTSVCISFNHPTFILEPTMNKTMVLCFSTATRSIFTFFS